MKKLLGVPILWILLVGATLNHDATDQSLVVEPGIKDTAIDGGVITGAAISGGTISGTTLTNPTFDVTNYVEDSPGTDAVSVQAPASLTAPYTLTLPGDNGNAGEALTTDGNGVLSWSAFATLPIDLTTDVTGVLPATNGGTGVANNVAATLTRSGNHALTITTTGVTNVTLPTSGTLVASPVAIADGGTGQTTQTAAFDALAPTTTKGDLVVHNGTDNVRQAVGTNGFALVADSGTSTGVDWEAVATDPTTTRGDLIHRGAAVLERLPAATDNRVVRGDGTDVVSGQIDDPNFFTSGAEGTSTLHGVFKKNLWQQKFLAADAGNATLTDLSYTLETGKTYRITVNLRYTIDAADVTFNLSIQDNAVGFGTMVISNNSGADDTTTKVYTTVRTMGSTALTFVSSGLAAGSSIAGDGTSTRTNVIVEELTNYATTSSW